MTAAHIDSMPSRTESRTAVRVLLVYTLVYYYADRCQNQWRPHKQQKKRIAKIAYYNSSM